MSNRRAVTLMLAITLMFLIAQGVYLYWLMTYEPSYEIEYEIRPQPAPPPRV